MNAHTTIRGTFPVADYYDCFLSGNLWKYLQMRNLWVFYCNGGSHVRGLSEINRQTTIIIRHEDICPLVVVQHESLDILVVLHAYRWKIRLLTPCRECDWVTCDMVEQTMEMF